MFLELGSMEGAGQELCRYCLEILAHVKQSE
jgi:hypothetical protein